MSEWRRISDDEYALLREALTEAHDVWEMKARNSGKSVWRDKLQCLDELIEVLRTHKGMEREVRHTKN